MTWMDSTVFRSYVQFLYMLLMNNTLMFWTTELECSLFFLFFFFFSFFFLVLIKFLTAEGLLFHNISQHLSRFGAGQHPLFVSPSCCSDCTQPSITIQISPKVPEEKWISVSFRNQFPGSSSKEFIDIRMLTSLLECEGFFWFYKCVCYHSTPLRLGL